MRVRKIKYIREDRYRELTPLIDVKNTYKVPHFIVELDEDEFIHIADYCYGNGKWEIKK